MNRQIKKDLYKKFLVKRLPIESRLPIRLPHDYSQGESVARSVENK